MSYTVAIIISWLLLFVCVRPAFAYIDPGSGGMMMQLLLGGVAGVVVLARLYWQRFTAFIGIKRNDSENQ